VMKADDKVIVDTIGGHAFTDPFLALVVLANELRSGPGLKAGQVLATGSFSG
jgi:2-keto-4-pentenoate hydratase